jgi:hypothetical protein
MGGAVRRQAFEHRGFVSFQKCVSASIRDLRDLPQIS